MSDYQERSGSGAAFGTSSAAASGGLAKMFSRIDRAPASLVGRIRTCLLWLGGDPPADLLGIAAVRGSLRIVSAAELIHGAVFSTARGLVIEVPDALLNESNAEAIMAEAEPLVDAALMNGLPVALVPEASAIAVTSAEAERIQRFCQLVEPLMHRSDPRINRCMRDWGGITRWMDDQAPGPAASSNLQLDGDLPSAAEVEAELLLRRAFHDVERVTLTRITGGKSGAAVWSVTVHESSTQRRPSPFLVKYNTLAKTRMEQSRYAQYADERVSFRLRPQIRPARCVEGLTNGLLVFDFIERAVSLRAALTTYPPAQLVGSLFGHTLAGCLHDATEISSSLESAFRRIKVLNWSAALDDVAVIALRSNASIPNVAQLRALMESLPAVPHRTATAHGDLHTGNLLVAAGSSDVLLIDFGSIEFGMPVATDPACLEVSLTFAPQEARAELAGRTAPADDEPWLSEAYQYPLEPFGVPMRYGRESWVTDAVRAIRGAVRQLESTTDPFVVAVASYLIRYASYADNGSLADRALAYTLAARLILALKEHSTSGVLHDQQNSSPEIVSTSVAIA